MLNAEVSRLLPVGFARDFDAHVYYDAGSRGLAEGLRAQVVRDFKGAPVFVGELRDRKVGPHPDPMFELNFPRRHLGEILNWFLRHRRGLSVLIHEVTGDDARDHGDGAIWLGSPRPLDASKFDPSPVSARVP